MLKMPLVSFVVTSYNYENFVIKTLESIKNQTYKNFEIIVVDDCSSDNSTDKIEEYISRNQDIRITLIKNDKNLGQLASMLIGLKAAQGQFISFIDSDDVIAEEYAEVHLRVHLSTSVAFTSAQIIEIDENDEIHTAFSVASPHKASFADAKKLEDLLKINIDNIDYKFLDKHKFGGWYWSPNSSAMFRKSVLEIFLNYKHAEKWKICPDKFLFNFADLIGGSAIIYAPLVGYRRHKQNAGGSDYVCGNVKYNSDKTTKVNICNNIKIRPEALRFLLENKKEFINKFGTRGFVKFICSLFLF